jgi:hypothetical protein
MPDLPGSNPEMDRKMLGDALFDPDLDADYYKVIISLPRPLRVSSLLKARRDTTIAADLPDICHALHQD